MVVNFPPSVVDCFIMTTKNMKTPGLHDYTAEQVEIFDEMHRVFSEYNARLNTDTEMPLPGYSRREMADYSYYRE